MPDDPIPAILKITARAMEQGQTLQELHAQCEAFALTNLLDDKNDLDGAAMMACGMSRSLWRLMPNPSRQFMIEKLPVVGRNDPCAIGLGCKHKQCCGSMPGFPVFDTEHCWAILCEVLPANRMQDILDSGRLPDGLLSLVAQRLVKSEPERVRTLLAPHFAGKLNPKDKHAGELLLVLCDALDELGEPDEKMALLERVAGQAVGQVRADALQRLTSAHSDRGDFDTAWKLFGEAQRVAPDDPALAHLEILLLISQHRDAEASARAKFWTARFERAGYDDTGFPLLKWLRQIGQGQDAFQATADLTADRLGEWEKRMIAAVEAGLAKPVATEHLRAVALSSMQADSPLDMEATLVKQLTGMGVSKREALTQAKKLAAEMAAMAAQQPLPLDDGTAEKIPDIEYVLTPDAHLQRREQEWHRAWPLPKPMSTRPMPEFTADIWAPPQVEFWVAFLEQHPDAMNSLDILDDLLIAVANMPDEDALWAAEALREKIYQRAHALLDAALPQDAELPWACPENRPALRMLAQQSIDYLHRDEPDALMHLHAVLRLNPNDNHGLRDIVVNLHLERGEDNEALAVIARYPDDASPAMCFGKVLALYRLGELAQATVELKEAHNLSPKIVRFLLPARKAEPKSSDYGVQIGGDDEAWLYRDEMRGIWQSVPGVMAWLKRMAG